MSPTDARDAQELARRLSEAEATIEALLSGQIDAVVDTASKTPLLLSKAQDALRESEERYRRIVETANEGIWTVDPSSRITFANHVLAAMLGYLPGELLGASLLQIFPESDHAEVTRRIERSRRGAWEESEVELARKGDHSKVWALLKTSPIRDAEGVYVGTLAMVTDRTRHKQAEQALRASEEQYRQIVEATSDGVIKVDVNLEVVFVNGRLAAMLGRDPQEMIGASALVLMSAPALESASEQFQRRPNEAVDTSLRHADGTEVAVNIAITRLIDEEGRSVGHLGVVRDVTERKKLQSQLMVSDRMASVGTLAAGVAHEINNPLVAVIANLDYVAEVLARRLAAGPSAGLAMPTEAWLVEELEGPLDDAREAADRVRFIVRDLKIFSRSPTEEPRGIVDVEAVIESSLRMAWNEIRHRARLVKSYGRVPGVEANEARLGQLFLNLLINAAQALEEGRADVNEIQIVTFLEDDRVVVEVRDTGAGIRPEIVDRIFDPFFTTKAVGVGTGLGLAICHRIVTDIGGELTVRSELGKGTTFRVLLPLARHDESEVVARAVVAPVPGRRGHILVVDDEELVLRGVKRILAKEHEVVTLVRAADALALCAGGQSFDLILSDLMMPEMTGMDLHRELALVAPAQADRMIFLTGGAFTPGARHFLSEPPKEHLEKPFDAANLRAIVQRYLR
ncbi:MAG: PAS domain S-box protein [Myxococcota bacterium]|nr:PAS domain S-box protein [Myxococcota bacterium]